MSDSLTNSPDSSQAQTPCPNFSRPRLGHRRSYSTGLPFQYTKTSSIKSQENGRPQTQPSTYTDHVMSDTEAEQRPRMLQTKDDGMVAYDQKKMLTEKHNWGEEDVTDAFQRWVLAEKARKKLKQAYFEKVDPETRFLSTPPQDVRRKVKDKGPIYEEVDGVVMDTRPAAPGPYGMELTIPEIEARDIRDIPVRAVIRQSESPEIEDDQGTPPASSTARSTESSGASPELWSESSGTSSTSSTDNSSLQPYRHISKQYVPIITDESDVLQQAMGSQSYPRQSMSQDTATSGISELDGHQLSLSPQPRGGRMTAQKLPLDVISEEAQGVNPEASDAAPAPNVTGLKEEDVTGHTLKTTARLKLGIVAALGIKSSSDSSPTHDTAPPSMLAAAGIGGDRHVYELEAHVPAQASTPTDSSSNGTGKEGLDVPKPNLLDKFEHGISKAAHALHDKVRKNVTFNPVNDVRFMTPSPNPSMDTIRAVGVDMRHEARS